MNMTRTELMLKGKDIAGRTIKRRIYRGDDGMFYARYGKVFNPDHPYYFVHVFWLTEYCLRDWSYA